MPTRRTVLGVAAASLASTLLPRRPLVAGERSLSVDFTFADLLVRHIRGDSQRAALLEHPALAAVVRHRQMSGQIQADGPMVLDRLIDSTGEVDGAVRVLDAWRGREQELIALGSAAADLLPVGTSLAGTAFFELGYDIGVAAPPDVLLNAAHPHFLDDPSEVAFYFVHELHHVGFLEHRPVPLMGRLREPGFLLELITYMTQLEGMAVHAAHAPRQAAGRLEADEDYRVYDDPAEAERIVGEYRRVRQDAVALGDRRPEDAELGSVLTSMSSGSRLWYRFGALVARAIEQRDGGQALVRTVVEPGPWLAEAERQLEGS